ncbi:MAG: diguanylate cyclase, partial [Gammaproteobacteria bacterium]
MLAVGVQKTHLMLPIDDSGAKTAPPSREKPLLLVVDDKQHNTTELVNKLSSFPLETHCTDNGRCALQLMRELQPNWVLLDMCLPDIDAYRLLNQIQADPRVCHIPLILMLPNLSSQAQLENNRLVWSRETLIKPIDPDAFKHIISLFLFMERGRRIVARMHAHHEALIDSKNEGLLGLNRAGRIVYVNNSGARLLQARPSQLVGLFMESIFEDPNRSVVSAWDEHPICTICQNKETILQVESAHFWCSQGESLPVKFAAVPVLKSTELSVVIAFRRLSATEQVTAGLKSGNPRRDALTGLSNRVDCVDVMKTLIHRAQQRNHSLSVFHVDVDHFANLNDTLGHAVGDELLVSV